jgi:hypothetical protein
MSRYYHSISNILYAFANIRDKSQEAMLDTLFWNTTLRSDPLAVSGTAAAKRTQETNRVLSSGLVAISINGNNITKSGIDFIRRAISTNHWFLGEFQAVTHSVRTLLLDR